MRKSLDPAATQRAGARYRERNVLAPAPEVTGKVNSAHTGPGTISNGLWAKNKLSMTLDFAKHESIAVTGSLKDGKLAGEFRTEGFVAKWEAKKKQ